VSIGYAFHIDPAAVYAWPADMLTAALQWLEEVAEATERAAKRR
jgi:hypothetical protein